MSRQPIPSSDSAGSPTSDMKDIALDHVCCILCMGCVETAPDFFAFDEDTDRIVVLHDQAFEEDIREAVNICPKACISLEP
ncbi:MAG: hypothetical protein PWQ57_1724 [Desulfovibrionales bacterium]|nr:hypothetical protein [Desulfovibrionales bacterium]